MATIAGDTSVYNANTDWENEEAYLSGLAKAGNNWAKDQLNALHEAKAMYTTPSTPVQTVPTQAGQPTVYTQPTGEYTHSLDGGKTYITGAQALAQKSGISEADAQALLDRMNGTGAAYSDILQAAYKQANNNLWEKELAERYARWEAAQNSDSAYIKGVPFETYLEMDGGLNTIQQQLANWNRSFGNSNVTVTPLDVQTYADILQRVSGGNLGGGELSEHFKAVNNTPTATTWEDVASLYTSQLPAGSVNSTRPAVNSGGSGSTVTGGNVGSATNVPTTNGQSALIEALYKAQQDAALAELEAAYEQNMLDLDAAAQKIPAIYQDNRNRAARDAAVAGRNFNEYAAASGLSSGAGAQSRLAMDNQLISGLSEISAQEATALAELENQRAKTKVAYKNAVASAIAEGDLAKAEALYKEAVRMDEMYVQQAYQNAQLELQYAELDRALANDKFEQELALQKLNSKSYGSPNPSPHYYDDDLDGEYTEAVAIIPTLEATLKQMKANGASTSEILEAIVEAKNTGALSQSGYLSLYNKYRG